MMTPREILTHITAEPFQPFRIHTASGRDVEIRHPEMAQVGRSTLTVFGADVDGAERWQKLSLMLVESVESIGAAPQSK